MKSLAVAYITHRVSPEAPWFITSLANQVPKGYTVDVIAVDVHGPERGKVSTVENLRVQLVRPKPTVWQGPHRLTAEDWWAASNARNTAICLCKTEWIAFVDDRSVLMPTWLEAVRDAMAGNYAVCGPYEKRVGMTVENGYIKHSGIITGEDDRLYYVKKHYSDPRHKLSNPYNAPGGWWYGCSTALPLEWALKVNGYDETCDGLSMEDCIFGLMLENNNLPIKFDTRMMIVEDRTAERLGRPMLRKDKGTSPNDKSHALLAWLRGEREAQHQWNLRELRQAALAGAPWPIPTKPDKDWYDGQPLGEM